MLSHLIGKQVGSALLGMSLVVASPAFAKDKGKGGGGSAPMTTGSLELGLSGLADLDSDDATAVYFDVTLGYFIAEGFELGLQTLQGTTRTGQRDTTGIFSEYNWLGGTILVPFGGMALKHVAPPAGTDETNGKAGAIYGGSKLMAGGNAALALTFVWEFADHSVLGPVDARKRRNRELNLGFKFFF